MREAKARCEEIAKYLIKSDYTVFKDLNTGKLASMFDVNRSYLSKTFKECIGMSLSQYIKRLKMLKIAILMIEKRHLKIWQISDYFGWDRSNNFIKSFKKFFAVTPGKFKELMHNQSARPTDDF